MARDADPSVLCSGGSEVQHTFTESHEVGRLRAMLTAMVDATGQEIAHLTMGVDPVAGVTIIGCLPRHDDEVPFVEALAAYSITARDMALVRLAQIVADTPGGDALWARAVSEAEASLRSMVEAAAQEHGDED